MGFFEHLWKVINNLWEKLGSFVFFFVTLWFQNKIEL
jgi:hypothetical protein